MLLCKELVFDGRLKFGVEAVPGPRIAKRSMQVSVYSEIN